MEFFFYVKFMEVDSKKLHFSSFWTKKTSYFSSVEGYLLPETLQQKILKKFFFHTIILSFSGPPYCGVIRNLEEIL